MITNERQYKITKNWHKKFSQSLQTLEQQTRPENVHLLLWKAEQDAIKSQLEEFQTDMLAYENLKKGTVRFVPVQSLDNFGIAFIQARIAKGYTQKDLAKELGVKEQQVQQDEENLYASASIRRLTQIAEVLGMQIKGQFELTHS